MIDLIGKTVDEAESALALAGYTTTVVDYGNGDGDTRLVTRVTISGKMAQIIVCNMKLKVD